MPRWCAVLCLAAAVQAQPILVVRAASQALAQPADLSVVDARVRNVSVCLDAVKADYRVVADTALGAASLAGVRLVVLPGTLVSEALADLLTPFVAQGGQVAAFRTSGSARLPALLGVRVGAERSPDYPGELSGIALTDTARSRYAGLPARFAEQAPASPSLAALAGAAVLGLWGREPLERRAAVVGNANGCYVGDLLSTADREAKGRFLLALAARDDPALWQPCLSRRHADAAQAVAEVVQRFGQLSRRADLSLEQRSDLAARVFSLSLRASLLPPPDGGEVAGALLELYRRTAAEAHELTGRVAVSRPHELRGLWVYSSRPIDWPRLCSQCANAGLNAIFYRVSRGASAAYPSALLPLEDGLSGRDEVALGVATCHRYGLEFHGWRVCFHQGSEPNAYALALRDQGRWCVDSRGTPAPFANPADPRNQELERSAVAEILRRYDVDGIHLDYFRYPDEPQPDYDFGPVSRRAFERARGAPVASWPTDVRRGALKPAYDAWERDTLSRLLTGIAAEVNRHPGVVLSAAVWRNHRLVKHTLKQDWPRWVADGLLDLVVPMDYDPDLDDVADAVGRQVAACGGQARMAAGLGSWLLDDPARLLAQVDAARDAGADGFVLFSRAAPQIDAQLAALALGRTCLATPAATEQPRARWRLPTALPRKDLPAVAAIEQPLPVWLELGPGWGTRRERVVGISASLSAERPESGERLAEAGRFVALDGSRAELTARFVPPSGRFQLVARGQLSRSHDKPLEFAVRGPVLEGWNRARFTAWQREHGPPAPKGRGLRVGVLADGLGSAGLRQALEGREGLVVAALHELSAAHLEPLQVAVITQPRDPDNFSAAALAALRAWVEGGGTALLTHSAVGWDWLAPPFPEVGAGLAPSRETRVYATAAYGVEAAGYCLRPAWPAHLQLAVGSAGRVIFQESGGQAVVVSGQVGRGRVILDGMLTGATRGTAPVPPDEAEMVQRLVAPAPP